MVISICGGAITGMIAGKCCNPDKLFDDDEHWMHVNAGEHAEGEKGGMLEMAPTPKANLVAPIDAGCVVSDPDMDGKQE